MPVRPLSPALGGEVLAQDFADFSPHDLRNALVAYQVVLVRGLSLDATSFRRIAQGLGPLRRVYDGYRSSDDFEDVQLLSNLDERGRPNGVHPDPSSGAWHTDGSALPASAVFTMLFALQVPRAGGETAFANMYAACEALSARRRRSLARRATLHDTTASRLPRSDLTRAVRRVARAASATHPVIRRHPETDRDALYVGDHAWSLAGSTSRRSRRAVAELNEFATSRDDWIYAHEWQVGDLVIWDNRCVLHRAMPYDLAEPRAMLRAVVEEEAANA